MTEKTQNNLDTETFNFTEVKSKAEEVISKHSDLANEPNVGKNLLEDIWILVAKSGYALNLNSSTQRKVFTLIIKTVRDAVAPNHSSNPLAGHDYRGKEDEIDAEQLDEILKSMASMVNGWLMPKDTVYKKIGVLQSKSKEEILEILPSVLNKTPVGNPLNVFCIEYLHNIDVGRTIVDKDKFQALARDKDKYNELIHLLAERLCVLNYASGKGCDEDDDRDFKVLGNLVSIFHEAIFQKEMRKNFTDISMMCM